MAKVTIRINSFDDVPAWTCDGCDSVFHIYWNRNPVWERPQHCPFCGEEFEEVEEIDE